MCDWGTWSRRSPPSPAPHLALSHFLCLRRAGRQAGVRRSLEEVRSSPYSPGVIALAGNNPVSHPHCYLSLRRVQSGRHRGLRLLDRPTGATSRRPLHQHRRLGALQGETAVSVDGFRSEQCETGPLGIPSPQGGGRVKETRSDRERRYAAGRCREDFRRGASRAGE